MCNYYQQQAAAGDGVGLAWAWRGLGVGVGVGLGVGLAWAWAWGLAVFGVGGGFFAPPPIWTEVGEPSVFKIYSYAYRKYQKSEKHSVNY